MDNRGFEREGSTSLQNEDGKDFDESIVVPVCVNENEAFNSEDLESFFHSSYNKQDQSPFAKLK